METIVHSTLVPSNRRTTATRFGTKLYALLSTTRLRPAKWILVLGASLLFSMANATTYYFPVAGNPASLALWWTNPAGTGTHPSNFTTAGDVFIIPTGILGTLANGGTLTIGTSVTLELQSASGNQITYSGGGSTLVISSGATLITANVNGLVNATTEGALSSNGKLTKTLNIAANYTFNGVTQTTLGLPATVNNLTFSGTGAKTLAAATTINGVFSLENGSNVNTYTGAITLSSTATLQYNAGTSTRTAGTEWATPFPGSGGVLIKGTGAITAGGSKNMNAMPLTIDAGAILDMQGNTLSGITPTNNGTIRFSGATNGLAIGTGTVEYYGSTSQTVTAGTYSTLKVSNTTGATISAATSAPTLTIDASGILNVTPTTPLTASTAITNNGTLNLQSDATGTATIFTPASSASITGSGTTNVSQYLTGGGGSTPNSRFWYTSNPLDGASTSGFGIGATSKLWKYTESSHAYTQILSNESMDKGRGYVSRLGANTTITHGAAGVKLTTGTQTVSITRVETDGKKGYNLVGNPYASYVTLDLADNPNIETSMWYRSMNLTSNGMVYDTRNMETGITVVNSIGGALTGDIAPMQAFWVRSTSVGTSNLTFKQTNTKHQPGTVKLRSAEVAQAPTIRVNVSNGIVSDETVIGFYANAKDTYDNYDSYKFSNENPAVPELFTYVGTDEVAINGLSPLESSRELALGFRTGTAGTFTLNATEISNMEEGTKVLLRDKLMNVSQDLALAPKYTFTSDIAMTDSRFSLMITKVATIIDKVSETPAFSAFAESNGRINVQVNNLDIAGAHIKLYAVSGKLLLTKPVEGTITTFDTNLPYGLYLVEVSREGFVGRNKIVIYK